MKICGKYARIILEMLIPEYTITPKILSNIGIFEYARAVIESKTILPSWKNQLRKEVKLETIGFIMENLGLKPNQEVIKKYVDGIEKTKSKELMNITRAYDSIDEISINKEIEEAEIKYIHEILGKDILPKTKLGSYRNKPKQGKSPAEEILAQMVQLFDWYNSLDAKETHPILKAGILKVHLEMISPFDTFNSPTIDFLVYTSLSTEGYDINGYLSPISCYGNSRLSYEQHISSIDLSDSDITEWLGFFCENLASEITNVKEKVNLLAKDTKVAKATGRVKLSARQERIVEYLQDYGQIQNKNFPQVFPDISEDTVLRDLKVLIKKGIVVKRGSTKSSRYELK